MLCKKFQPIKEHFSSSNTIATTNPTPGGVTVRRPNIRRTNTESSGGNPSPVPDPNLDKGKSTVPSRLNPRQNKQGEPNSNLEIKPNSNINLNPNSNPQPDNNNNTNSSLRTVPRRPAPRKNSLSESVILNEPNKSTSPIISNPNLTNTVLNPNPNLTKTTTTSIPNLAKTTITTNTNLVNSNNTPNPNLGKTTVTNNFPNKNLNDSIENKEKTIPTNLTPIKANLNEPKIDSTSPNVRRKPAARRINTDQSKEEVPKEEVKKEEKKDDKKEVKIEINPNPNPNIQKDNLAVGDSIPKSTTITSPVKPSYRRPPAKRSDQ